MRRSYLLMLLCVLIAPFAFFGCARTPNAWVEAKPGQKKILVSFAPLYAITHAVAGDDAYVLCMLTSQGPHEYEGSPTDVFMVNKADLLIYNGLTLDDPFIARMLSNHTNSSLQVLNIGNVLEKKHHELMLHAEHEHDHGHAKEPEHGHDHKHGEHDPHIWLGPKQAIQMTKIIADKLGAIDPSKKQGYEERANKFIDELKKLQADGEAAFKNKKNKKIITMHEAFAYFADGFGIEIVESIQPKPGMDPDAASLAKLIKICRAKDGPRVITVEPQYSSKVAEAIQAPLKKDGIDVAIITLDPLETAEAMTGKKNPDPGYYLKKMRENIDALAKALP